jgi:hypothetical protein
MYACMYVCMYVYIHVCKYISMYVCIYYPPTYVLVSPMVSFPQVSPPTPCTHLSLPPYVPHAPPISFFSVSSPAQYWVRSTSSTWVKERIELYLYSPLSAFMACYRVNLMVLPLHYYNAKITVKGWRPKFKVWHSQSITSPLSHSVVTSSFIFCLFS